MKTLTTYIAEKLKITKDNIGYEHKYFPSSKTELFGIIYKKFEKDDFDLTDIDVSKITNFDSLFEKSKFAKLNRKIVVSIDVTGWQTSQVTTMESLFSGQHDLEEIIGLETWDVSNVISFKETFMNCKNLKELNLNGWNVSSVTTFREMFDSCESLEKIHGIENFNFGPNCNMISYMFSNCKNIKTLNLDNWNTKNISWFSGMFYGSGIEHIDLRDWDTSALYSCVAMFKECNKLESMLGLETWDLSKCVDSNNMFYNCGSLETIGKCENLDLSRVLSTERMFESCKNLTLNASKWKYHVRCKRTNMFKNTSKNIIKK